METILFYGDSNTWGYDPATGGRYPYNQRWTTICAEKLGPGFLCIPSGMNGRTTAFDDPVKGSRNGLQGLDYALQTNKPINLLVIMLGTNDLKYTDAQGSARGMERLIERALTADKRFPGSFPVFQGDPKILLVSPVLVTGTVNDCLACDEKAESEKLSSLYQKIAQQNGLNFMDAAKITQPSEADGVHLGIVGHLEIGYAMARNVLEILAL